MSDDGLNLPWQQKPCLLYTGSANKDGYGDRGSHRRPRLAHRAAYEDAYGPIPEGMLVCHHCDVRLCIEPIHLFLGTHGDNNRDAYRKGRTKQTFLKNENHRMAKFSDAEVATMRDLHSKGMKQTEIMKIYGISSAQISRIINRKRRG